MYFKKQLIVGKLRKIIMKKITNKSIVHYTSLIMNNENSCGIKLDRIEKISDKHMDRLLISILGA